MSTELVAWVLAAVAMAMLAREARERRRLDSGMAWVTSASHELRGALAAMSLALSRFEEPPRPNTWRDTIDALRAQQARAQLAAEDLEAARGSGPERAVDARCTVDVEALVRRSVRSWAAAHGRWRVVLDWRAGRPTVLGEVGRLGQALDNLIENAIEHGAGRVTVVGRVSGGSVLVSVLDLGHGLGHSLKDVRPASWRSRRGHGLAIVRRAIEDHGGRMRLVRESRGMGVEICLPLAPEAPTASALGAAHPAPGPSGVTRSA